MLFGQINQHFCLCEWETKETCLDYKIFCNLEKYILRFRQTLQTLLPLCHLYFPWLPLLRPNIYFGGTTIFFGMNVVYLIFLHTLPCKKNAIQFLTMYYCWLWKTVCGQNFYPILTSTQKFMHHYRSLLPDVEVLLGVMVKTSRRCTKLIFKFLLLKKL